MVEQWTPGTEVCSVGFYFCEGQTSLCYQQPAGELSGGCLVMREITCGVFFCFWCWEWNPLRALHMLGKCSTTDLHPQPTNGSVSWYRC
jgi:hypothetical protein